MSYGTFEANPRAWASRTLKLAGLVLAVSVCAWAVSVALHRLKYTHGGANGIQVRRADMVRFFEPARAPQTERLNTSAHSVEDKIFRRLQHHVQASQASACADVSPLWRDTNNNTCQSYISLGYCLDGHAGPDWKFGDLRQYQASRVCCACGGGIPTARRLLVCRVFDLSDGASVVGAQVEISRTMWPSLLTAAAPDGMRILLVSDRAGIVSTTLPPGEYRYVVRHQGFQIFYDRLRLGAAAMAYDLPIGLSPTLQAAQMRIVVLWRTQRCNISYGILVMAY